MTTPFFYGQSKIIGSLGPPPLGNIAFIRAIRNLIACRNPYFCVKPTSFLWFVMQYPIEHETIFHLVPCRMPRIFCPSIQISLTPQALMIYCKMNLDRISTSQPSHLSCISQVKGPQALIQWPSNLMYH
jgi:hypothetical protein